MAKQLAKLLITLLLSSLILGTAFAENSDQVPTSPFPDVKAGNSHYVAILGLNEAGILNGYADGTFKPDKEINRAEALKVITMAAGLTIDTDKEAATSSDDKEKSEADSPIFSDVTSDDWFANYVKTAKGKKIISGYEDYTFRPSQAVNLVETLKLYFESKNAVNSIDFPEQNDVFKDTPKDSWYLKYTTLANSKETLDISAKNEIFPDKKMTRGEFAEIIYRLKQSEEKGSRFGKATFYGKAVQGHGTASGDRFDMNGLTAAHRTLPFGTLIEVTNLSNGKKIEVKITDRGPYGPGRVLDLSSAAFGKLAPLGAGVIRVQYRQIDTI